jgi:hypothetical protein
MIRLIVSMSDFSRSALVLSFPGRLVAQAPVCISIGNGFSPPGIDIIRWF